jgi:Ca-activated chloride channel homolog
MCLFFFTLFIGGGPVAAQHGEDKCLSPYFYLEKGESSVEDFPLKKTDVTVSISGVIADVRVLQTYRNNGAFPINARYIFPASTRAAVYGMKMTINEKVITAKVMERVSAQKKFNLAKAAGKSASLLKQQRPNVFSMNVANIMPNDTIGVELRYTELIIPTNNTYTFVYPTVVGPRYANQAAADSPETDLWVKNPYLAPGTKDRVEFNISVDVSGGIPIKEISCSTHETHTAFPDDKTAGIRLSPSERSGGNRDFILNYRLAGNRIESGLSLYEGPDENFFLLMVQPPERVLPADIPPREYIFVVDISGSMHGFPLNTAKKLLKKLIGGLNPSDRFNVVLFAGGSKLMAPSSIVASADNIKKAVTLIDRQQGGGGTELYRALEKGLALPLAEGVSRTMLVITDGYIAAESDVFTLISENLNRNNLFAFGIGSSVNRYLIEGMAAAGQGEPFVVTRPEQAAAVSARFKDYVASPVLTDIRADYDGFDAYDVEPAGIPDLFARRPVVIFGKYHGIPAGEIRLTGAGGRGVYEQAFNVGDMKPADINSPLRQLWARNRISRLSDFNMKKKNPETRDEVTSLGLTYNLLTAYTSFVAVQETVRNTQGPAKDVTQPLPLPKNVSHLAVGGCKTVPEPELGLFLVVSAFIGICAGLKRRKTAGCKN